MIFKHFIGWTKYTWQVYVPLNGKYKEGLLMQQNISSNDEIHISKTPKLYILYFTKNQLGSKQDRIRMNCLNSSKIKGWTVWKA